MDRTSTLLERIEISSLEHKVNEMQLLEAMLAQRNQLVSPRSLVRDHKAHNSLPAYYCNPASVSYEQIGGSSRFDVLVDTGVWILCRDPFWSSCSSGSGSNNNNNSNSNTSGHGSSVGKMTQNLIHGLNRNSSGHSNTTATNTGTNATTGKQLIYVHKASNAMQIGEPFDFLMKKHRGELRQDKW